MATEITKTSVDVLVPPEYSAEIFTDISRNSKALELFRRLPDMTRNQTIVPVIDQLPIAYFQASDTAHKNLTSASWKGVQLHAGEVAVIIPISENVFDDATINIWERLKPEIANAFAKVIDSAIFTGVGKPSFWPDGLLTKVTASGNAVTQKADESLYEVINRAMGAVEEDGYEVTGIAGGVGLKSKFRGMVDKNGQPLNTTEIGSLKRTFVNNGAWDKSVADFIVGDFNQAVYAIRQDLTYKVLTEATLVDPSSKEILYNLAQQDMIALRVTMRLAWAVPNPVNQLNADEGTRYPFASVKLV